MTSFEYLKAELHKIKGIETERSFYPILSEFFKRFASENISTKHEYNVISEASSKVYESKVGFPDLTIQIKDYDYKTLGWVEVKLPSDQLSDQKFEKQFTRYKESLENVLFTNLREWSLYQWNEKDKPHKVGECLFDADNFDESSAKNLVALLEKFFDGKVLSLKTPKQLALALARKTRMLSQQFEDCLESDLENPEHQSDLIKLHDAFSKTLIKDIAPHQFSNMLAETIAYSLFLAALEHDRRENSEQFNLRTAIDYLPKSVPILSDMYEITSKVSSKIPEIAYAISSLIEQLKYADIHKIHNILTNHSENKDPVIHFYEPFLAEYDPKEREARGVYYTPKPVVDYMVRSVDYILKNKFNKISGLADPDVYVLDPATGTGTFLMGAIEMLYHQKQRQFGPLGAEIVTKEFCRTVRGHVLKHFFGFELMVAPYAIAHLKLTLLLESYGFSFEQTANNNDSDDNRLQIYLTNSLEEPQKSEEEEEQTSMFTFMNAISKENQKASEVKLKKPIMAIIGNPPYSGQSSNNGDWIRGLVKDYYFVDGLPLGEKNPKWLQDDYVKFIRLAQWKIEQTGEGVIAFITNHGYLENPTFRGMRQQLMQHFNEIYVFDLHGNSLKKEKTPEGGKDENVFNIQAGVAIIFLLKKKGAEGCEIYKKDLFGVKTEKFEYLEKHSIDSTNWERISPKKEFYLFKKEDEAITQEYGAFMKVNKIFQINSVGVVTGRDSFAIDYDKNTLKQKINFFLDEGNSNESLKQRFNLKESKNWQFKSVRTDLKLERDLDQFYQKISYRPFDDRSIFYHRKIIERSRKEVMQHMLKENIGLITARSNKSSDMDHFFCTRYLMEAKCGERTTQSALFPLFHYENSEKLSNINSDFVQKISIEIGKDFDLDQTIHIYDYIYGILYLPNYRQKYSEQLGVDFPRIPLPSQVIEAKLLTQALLGPQEAFSKISQFGEKLRNLHLMTDSIFQDSSKWDVKVGGQKTENLEDWKVTQVKYIPTEKRIYVNPGQYFEGIDPEVWAYHIGGYQVLDKWLKERKNAGRCLDSEDLIHYLKIIVSLRETIKITNGIKS